MDKDKCTMPNCENEQVYAKLGVCRSCYGRIWWLSNNYGKTLEQAKAACFDLDETAQKHGLSSYAHKRRY